MRMKPPGGAPYLFVWENIAILLTLLLKQMGVTLHARDEIEDLYTSMDSV